MSVEILCGDAREVLQTLPPASVHACICSPPYFGLRSYAGGEQEIGTEQMPDCRGCGCGTCYVCHLVEVFRSVHRVLREDGTCWIVLGDSYASAWPCSRRSIVGQPSLADGKRAARPPRMGDRLKDKDLIMIPHRVAIALQDAGWYVRQELIWSKPAPMPESVRDRCTRSHEFIFMLTKQPAYSFDAEAIAEPAAQMDHFLRYHTRTRPTVYADKNEEHGFFGRQRGHGGLHNGSSDRAARRNKRSVWSVGPQPLGEEHYAAFPEKLVEPMVLASTSEAGCCAQCGTPWPRVVQHERTSRGDAFGRKDVGRHDHGQAGSTYRAVIGTRTMGWAPGCACVAGAPIPCTVLDPFAGSGTVGLVTRKLGRNAVLIDLNPAYCDLAQRRVDSVPYPLFSAAGTSDGAAR